MGALSNGNENVFKGQQTSCAAGSVGSQCNTGYATNYWHYSGLPQGTNFFEDPVFNNTSDLVANHMGAPNCAGFENTTQCMGWDAYTSTLTTNSVIYDLVPTCADCTAKGYQKPSTTCSGTGVSADFPTWLKGIVYLHWTGSAIVQRHGLVTTPCGL